MDIFTTIDDNTVPELYINRYKENNLNVKLFSNERINNIVVRRIKDNLTFTGSILDMELDSFSKINTDSNLDIAKDILYSYAVKHIGLFNDKFENRLLLLTGGEQSRKIFSDKLEKDIRKTLEKHHKLIETINNSIDAEAVLNDKNPKQSRIEYGKTLYRLKHDPFYLTDTPKMIKKMKEVFAKDSMEFLKLREEELQDIKSEKQGDTFIKGKNNLNTKTITPHYFEDLFIPPYNQHVDQFILVLYSYADQEEGKTWKGHKGYAKIFYDILIDIGVIYPYSHSSNPTIRKGDVALLFERKFPGLGKYIINASPNSKRIEDQLSFKQALKRKKEEIDK